MADDVQRVLEALQHILTKLDPIVGIECTEEAMVASKIPNKCTTFTATRPWRRGGEF